MIILDTHIWIWWINQTLNRLSNEVIKRIEQEQIIAISAISYFEVAWLAAHKRIIIEIPIQEWITQATENAGIVTELIL